MTGTRCRDSAALAPVCGSGDNCTTLCCHHTGKSPRFSGLSPIIRNAGCIFRSGSLGRSYASCWFSMIVVARIRSPCIVSWQTGRGRRSGHGTDRPGFHTLIRNTRTVPGITGGRQIRSAPGKRRRRGTTTGIDVRCFSRIFRRNTSRQS